MASIGWPSVFHVPSVYFSCRWQYNPRLLIIKLCPLMDDKDVGFTKIFSLCPEFFFNTHIKRPGSQDFLLRGHSWYRKTAGFPSCRIAHP